MARHIDESFTSDLDGFYKLTKEYLTSHPNTEFEYKYNLTNSEIHSLMNSIKEDFIERGILEQTTNIIYENGVILRALKNNTVSTKNWYTKERLLNVSLHKLNHIKLSMSEENDISKPTEKSNVELIRVKNRISIPYDFFRLDITQIKEDKPSSGMPDISRIKKIQQDMFSGTSSLHGEKLFDVFLNESRNNKTEVEIEVFNDKITSYKQLMINNITKQDIPKLSFFTVQNTLVSHIMRLTENDYHKRSVKQLTPPSSTLSKNEYNNKIYPPFGYFISRKADGDRCFVCILEKGYVLLTSKNADYQGEIDQNIICIVDSELIGERILIFDVLYYKGENVTKLPYKDRVKFIGDVIVDFKKIFVEYSLETKQILEITEDTIGRVLKDIDVADSADFKDDGHMLTKGDQSYYETKSWKIKPENTIDFLVVKYKKEYYLFSGIRKEILNKQRIRRPEVFWKIFNKTVGNYVPVQFSPPDDPTAYKYKPEPKIAALIDSNMKSFDNMKCQGTIVELLPTFNEIGEVTWEFIMIRTDRLNESSYFGNDYGVSVSNWLISKDPIRVKDMYKPVSTYFEHTKSSMYKKQVAYVSVCKTNIIQTVKDMSSNTFILDIACGKGQDLNRITGEGFTKALFTDVDPVALSELNTRRYDSVVSNKYEHVNNSLNVAIQQANMSDEFSVNKKKFDKHIVDGKPGSAICNLAIHYFVHNIDTSNKFMQFLNYIMNHENIFAYTCFDGETVFNLLKNNDGEWLDQEKGFDKYRIKAMYTDDVFTGSDQRISVKLPMSTDMKEEYLVDVKAFNALALNYGYKVHSSGSLLAFYDKLSKSPGTRMLCNSMNESDKFYAGLYSYTILVK